MHSQFLDTDERNVRIKTAYEPHARVQLTFDLPSETKQSFKNECDINNILTKYRKTGLLDHVSQYGGRYGDFSSLEDYQSSLNKIDAAKTCFQSLPSMLRKRFGNDPALFLEFVQNPANSDELVKLGLATRREPAAEELKKEKKVQSGQDS